MCVRGYALFHLSCHCPEGPRYPFRPLQQKQKPERQPILKLFSCSIYMTFPLQSPPDVTLLHHPNPPPPAPPPPPSSSAAANNCWSIGNNAAALPASRSKAHEALDLPDYVDALQALAKKELDRARQVFVFFPTSCLF